MRRYLLAAAVASAVLPGCSPAWAQRTSDFPAASAINASDLIACVQGYTIPGTGTTRKCTAAQIAALGLGFTPLAPANNLSDLQSAATARTNLGLAAVASSGSATDLGAGTLPAARLPNPSASTLGGVESLTAQAHQFLTGISTLGIPQAAQPAFTDISGNPSSAQVTGGLGYTPFGGDKNLTFNSTNGQMGLAGQLNQAYGLIRMRSATTVATGSITGLVLTVATVTQQTKLIAAGQVVLGVGANVVIGNTTIVNQLSGTAGGVGTYTVSNSQTVASGTLNLSGADTVPGLDMQGAFGSGWQASIFDSASVTVPHSALVLAAKVTNSVPFSNDPATQVVVDQIWDANNEWGVITTSNVTLVAPGLGYVVGEVITLNDGCKEHVAIQALTVDGVDGHILTFKLWPLGGTGRCIASPGNPVAQLSTTGAGTGATFNLAFGSNYSNLYIGAPSDGGIHNGKRTYELTVQAFFQDPNMLGMNIIVPSSSTDPFSISAAGTSFPNDRLAYIDGGSTGTKGALHLGMTSSGTVTNPLITFGGQIVPGTPDDIGLYGGGTGLSIGILGTQNAFFGGSGAPGRVKFPNVDTNLTSASAACFTSDKTLISLAACAGLTAINFTGAATTTPISSQNVITDATATNQFGFLNGPTFQPSAVTLASLFEAYNVPTLANSATNITNLYGNFVQLNANSTYTGTVATATEFAAGGLSFGAGVNPIGAYRGFVATGVGNGNGITSGSVTNTGFLAGVNTAAAASGGTVTNKGAEFDVGSGSGAGHTLNYGVFITGNGGSGGLGVTDNWSFYNNSTAPSFFTGNVTFGALNTTGVIAGSGCRTAAGLDVYKAGANCFP